MNAFDEAVFWPIFKDAGMLVQATVRPKDCAQPTATVDVDLEMPDALGLAGNAISRQYTIEYQHQDLPLLAEGDEVEIAGIVYRVREAPFVDERAPTGFFRRALLTRVADDCA